MKQTTAMKKAATGESHCIHRRPLQGMLKLAQRQVRDATRTFLYQVRIERVDGDNAGSRWVFTDGHTMHVWEFEGWQPPYTLAVSAEHLGVLIAALKGTVRDTEASMFVDEAKGKSALRVNHVSVPCLPDEGRDAFPAWSRVIPAYPVRGAAQESVAVGVDPRYVADAMTAILTLPEAKPRVTLHTGSALDPLRIDAEGWTEPAVAGEAGQRVKVITVIMPRRLP